MTSLEVKNTRHAVKAKRSEQLKIFDDDGKITQATAWIAGLLLMLMTAPIWWIFAQYGRMTQGMFAAVSNAVLGLQALQYPRYFKAKWLYVLLLVLSISYILLSLLMPNSLPKNTPTSFFLWPFVLITIGINHFMIKICAKALKKG
jgi:hypothetical protein